MYSDTTAIYGFWLCIAAVGYTYFIYPVVIWVLSRVAGRKAAPPEPADADCPEVSLVLAAYNEEDVIGDRLVNALGVDYPSDRYEVVVGSDGSTDGTAEIVRRFADRGVRLLAFDRNRGKASVLNSATAVGNEIFVMSDANTHFHPAAVRRLVRWFRDPAVGAVVGRLVLVDPRTGQNADGLYWKYETFLKRCEGRLGALLGANGAIYAIRKDLYVPVPPATIVDDFVIPLLAKLRSGCTIVYDEEAAAVEETPPRVRAEFHRRARIGAGGFQAIGLTWRLLDPRQGWVAFSFLSHKVLRWLCPFFLIGALAGSLLLCGRPFYRGCLAAQAGFYLLSLLLLLVPARVRLLRPLRLATMFTVMNAALLVGSWRWVRGLQGGTWRRTVRTGKVKEFV